MRPKLVHQKNQINDQAIKTSKGRFSAGQTWKQGREDLVQHKPIQLNYGAEIQAVKVWAKGTFIIPARTAPPRYTICFLRGGSSIRNRSFCSSPKQNIQKKNSDRKLYKWNSENQYIIPNCTSEAARINTSNQSKIINNLWKSLLLQNVEMNCH